MGVFYRGVFVLVSRADESFWPRVCATEKIEESEDRIEDPLVQRVVKGQTKKACAITYASLPGFSSSIVVL
jgi:hypothetical protein